MARQKNQERARRTILDAALATVADRGVGRVRIRDVAEFAGVSPGTVHYYFEDLDNLLRTVHREAGDRFFTERLEMVTGIIDARRKLGALIWAGLPESDADALVVALYRLEGYTNIAAAHGDLITSLFEKQVALYLTALEVGVAQGHFLIDAPILDVAANFVALEDAYGLHIVGGNRTMTKARAARLICSYACTATCCPDIVTPPKEL
ncbi:TetR/AcrR family transcriptional regulator [Nocardia acidivorans]|uniref:TetR/AcrR family transcriptional regulator n=1 Tax=Nocardia acidivorans TaxID=404580 RepID=UPI0008361327|nr:TetR/AcrR family transcriptional regulator [Nocardia acidivorans]